MKSNRNARMLILSLSCSIVLSSLGVWMLLSTDTRPVARGLVPADPAALNIGAVGWARHKIRLSLVNQESTSVALIGIETSCDCIHTSIGRATLIASRAQLSLPVEWNTHGRSGDAMTTLVVVWRNTATDALYRTPFTLSATVTPTFALVPDRLTMHEMPSQRRRVQLKTVGESSAAIIRTVPSTDALLVYPLPNNDGIEVAFDDQKWTPTGRSESIRIELSDSNHTTLTLPVRIHRSD